MCFLVCVLLSIGLLLLGVDATMAKLKRQRDTVSLSSSSSSSSSSRNFFIKWITADLTFPLWIEKNVSLVDADYKWYKYSENIYIDEIDNYLSQYVYSQTSDKTILYLLTYNYTTHEQLSTYEPRVVGHRGDVAGSAAAATSSTESEHNHHQHQHQHQHHQTHHLGNANVGDAGDDEQRDIFTLAYLKSHVVNTTRMRTKTDVSCLVTVMLPINDDYINERNYQLVAKYIYLKMSVTTPSSSRSPMRKKSSRKEQQSNNNNNSNKSKHSLRAATNMTMHDTTMSRRRSILKRDEHVGGEQQQQQQGQARRRKAKQKAKEHVKVKKMSYRADKATRRTIPSSFLEIELREGPISFYSIQPNEEDKQTQTTPRKEEISCTLGLIDFDDTIFYENTIYKSVWTGLNENDDENAAAAAADGDDLTGGDKATSRLLGGKAVTQSSGMAQRRHDISVASISLLLLVSISLPSFARSLYI